MLNENEIAVLQGIVRSEYQSDYSGSEDVINHPIWSFSIDYNIVGKDDITGKKLSGYVSALKKKGMVGCRKDKGDDETCWITKEGYDYLKSNNLIEGRDN